MQDKLHFQQRLEKLMMALDSFEERLEERIDVEIGKQLSTFQKQQKDVQEQINDLNETYSAFINFSNNKEKQMKGTRRISLRSRFSF
jgi:uncharacterized protein YukE